MSKRILVVAGVFAVVLALGSSVVWAAGAFTVDVPFAWVVNDTNVMPAGHYEIRVQGGENSSLLIIKGSGNTTVMVNVIERLADTGGEKIKVVFDNVKGKHFLSEVHLPGQDGFLVGITKGEESHEVLTAKP